MPIRLYCKDKIEMREIIFFLEKSYPWESKCEPSEISRNFLLKNGWDAFKSATNWLPNIYSVFTPLLTMLLLLFPPLHHIHVLRGSSFLFPFICSCCVVFCPPSGTITIQMCGYATHLHSPWNLLQYLRLRLCRAELLASLLLAALPWAHRPPGLLPVLRSSGQRDAQGRKWPQLQFSQPSVTETPHDFSHLFLLSLPNAAALVQATIISLSWIIKNFHLDSLSIAFLHCSLKIGIWPHHLPPYSLRWLSIVLRIKIKALSMVNTYSMPRSWLALPPPLCPPHASQSIALLFWTTFRWPVANQAETGTLIFLPLNIATCTWLTRNRPSGRNSRVSP